jgi:putative flippase GtrA
MGVAAIHARRVSLAACDRLWQRALGWLGRHERTAIVGPLFGYARAHASQLARFVLVGAGLAILNLAFLYAMRTWLHLSDPAAVTAMYVFGVLIHFPSHRQITYAAHGRPVWPQILLYVVMLVFNYLVMQTVVALTSHVSISPYIGVMIAVGLTMGSNFLAMAHVVFANRRQS